MKSKFLILVAVVLTLGLSSCLVEAGYGGGYHHHYHHRYHHYHDRW